jgi:hypothetical protein
MCRGEAPLKIEPVINGDRESGMADMMLRAYVFNIVYVPHDYDNARKDVINIESENPIYWFNVSNSDIRYMIGVRLDDLMRTLLNSDIKHPMIWGAFVSEIFRVYIRHLKWRLKHEGVKYTNQDFKGIRDIDGYNLLHRPQMVYGTMSRIFTNYTKQKAKWQMK